VRPPIQECCTADFPRFFSPGTAQGVTPIAVLTIFVVLPSRRSKEATHEMSPL
jgi:hypothetical protein